MTNWNKLQSHNQKLEDLCKVVGSKVLCMYSWIMNYWFAGFGNRFSNYWNILHNGMLSKALLTLELTQRLPHISILILLELMPQEQVLGLDQRRSELQHMLQDFHYTCVVRRIEKINVIHVTRNCCWDMLTFVSAPQTIRLQYLVVEMFRPHMPSRGPQFPHFLRHLSCSSPHKRELPLTHYAFVVPMYDGKWNRGSES